MSNFDKLSVDNSDKENVTVSVVEPKKKETVLRVVRPTIFSVLLANIKQDTSYLNSANKSKQLPNFKYTFLVFFSLILLALLCLVINLAVLPIKTIPLLLLFLPAALPALIIVFYMELNVQSKLKIFNVFFAFLTGVLIFFGIDFISNIIFRFIPNETFNEMASPVFYSLFTFLFSFLLCNLFKTTKMGECFIIVVAVSLGFYFIMALASSFDKLFILDGTIQTGSFIAPPGAGVIIDNSDYLRNNLAAMMENWWFDYLVLPYLYACWSSVIGFLVCFAAENKRKKREAPKSIYLLLMLVILFNVVAVLDTAIGYLSVILKMVSMIGSSLIAVVFINIYIQED